MLISLPPIAEPSDRQFMSDLYEQFGRLMYAKAIAYLDDPQDADDLIQNCLEQLIKNVATLRTLDENKLTNYIAVTVRNAALNLEKRNDTKAQHSFLTDFEDDAPSDASAVPEEILLTREFSAGFWRVFKTLPETEKKKSRRLISKALPRLRSHISKKNYYSFLFRII